MDNQADPRKLTMMAIGCMLGIGAVTFLSQEHDIPILIASFGATAVLIYGVPESPLARPKNVFFGHLFSSLIGVACFILMGCEWYSMTLAVTLSIAIMTVTGTLHPPGGATALVCVDSLASPGFVLFPVMTGVVVLMAIAWMMNLISERFFTRDQDLTGTERSN